MQNTANLEGARLIGAFIAAIVAAWVIADATKRGKGGAAFLWGLGVFLLLIVFLPLYLYFRSEDRKVATPERQATLCRYCGLYAEGDPVYCPHCGKQLKSSTEVHRTP